MFLRFSLFILFSIYAQWSFSQSCMYEGMGEAIDLCSGSGGGNLHGYGLSVNPTNDPKVAGASCTKNGGPMFWITLPTYCYPEDITGPTGGGPSGGVPPVQGCGSVINYDQQIVSESIPVVGTPFTLNYSSNRVPGYGAGHVMRMEIAPASSSYVANMVQVDVSMAVAGNTFTHTDTTLTPYETYSYAWNGLDSSSNPVYGTSLATITIQKTLAPGIPAEAADVNTVKLSRYNVKKYGLGGWMLSPHHFYDPVSSTIYRGDGTFHGARSKPYGGGTDIITASDDGTEIYVFNASGKHLSTLNGMKGTTKYSFNYTGDVLNSITDGYGNVTTINHSSGNPTSIVGPYGQITALTVDGNGYLKDATNPNSEKTEMTYYAGGLLNTFEKPNGVVSTMTYDGSGLLLSDVNSAGNSTTISASYSNSVDYRNQRNFTVTSDMGITKTFNIKYSPYTYTREQTDAGYAKRTAEYIMQSGLLENSIEKLPNQTSVDSTYQYDVRLGVARRVPKRIVYGLPITYGLGTTFGQGVNLSDPNDIFSIISYSETHGKNGQYTYVNYYESDSKYTTTSPLGKISTRTIDGQENTIQTKQATFTAVDYDYDANGRLIEVAQGARVWTLGYNVDGYLDSVEDPLNQITSYGYDLAGRVTSVTLPDTRVIGYGYDSSGNLTSVTPPSKPAQDMSYNGFDLISQYLAATPTTYAYNDDKQVTLITRPSGDTIAYNYNGTSGRLTSVVIPTGTFTVVPNSSWDYIDSITSPDGVVQTYVNNAHLLMSVANSGTTTGTLTMLYSHNFWLTSMKVDANTPMLYAYDNEGYLTDAGSEVFTRSGTTGLTSQVALDNITEDFTYSAGFGELSSIEAKYTSSNIYKAVYSRDAVGRITQKVETVGAGSAQTYDYTYDGAGRLTDVELNGSPFRGYTYDTNGNRTQVTGAPGGTLTATYNTADQLTLHGSKGFQYNTNGEVDLITDSSGPALTTAFTYDAMGTLKSVTMPSTTTYNYLYDGKNRRVGKKVGSTLVKQYTWFDDLKLIAEYDGAGTLISQFVYGEKANVPDYMIQGATKYKIVTDHLGSVVAVINSSTGAVAQRISYDPFGRVLSDTNPGFQPFGFAGGLYDSDTGLVRFGVRDYDAETGRWLSKDPILFAGGDTNLYGYLLNDPINFIDPSGTMGMPPWWVPPWRNPPGMLPDGEDGAVLGDAIRDTWFPVPCFGSIPCEPKPSETPPSTCNPIYQSCQPKQPPNKCE